ncbi:YggS family pyridoxal phosphate-dependent enzyme, partial [Bacteroides coprosuis]|uniref:YggS family pyridoxal phosphate-dependent enzyme n=1 Tax=Bacteroides coprosuis TaxID=151276 RepID=UPI001DEFB6F1
WHFIGHLQSNKIKYIAPFISLIHSVDTFRLLKNINKEAKKEGRIIPCLLQLHIADEDTKYGFSFTECRDMLKEGKWKELKNVKIAGVMGMATFTEDENLVKNEFKALKDFFSEIQKEFFTTNEDFTEISMGMSQDYPIAIKEGSTLIRVGSKIFGERIY